jgi:hypothetical protein
VVSDYTLKDTIASPTPTAIAAVPSPLPVASSGSSISVYWISSAGTIAPGIRYVRMTAQASGVTGPLFADVYYPVSTPVPTVTASPNKVGLPSNYPETENGVANCGELIWTAIALGNPCTTFGMTWNYRTSVPSYGAGFIAMAQIVNSSSVSASGTPSPNPNSYTSFGLDTGFPYVGATPTSALWNSNDSPADPLTTPPICHSVTETVSFTDYFMYQPGTTSSRIGHRLWVTEGTMSWNFSGTATATSKKGSHYALGSTTNPRPLYTSSTTLPTWSQIASLMNIDC